ncbi:MAG: aspartate/glutamate racemase family protein, partial [Eudoraea sp.]|nr:aspartate/glutamate racemase family protein [Eudoraea sp.]
MKTIGLIGGMSWESSLEYYRIINETVKEKLGGHHSADCLMYSVDFGPVKDMQYAGEWESLTELMKEAALRLKNGGAGLITICTNTMHQMYSDVQEVSGLPVIHIADTTAEAIKSDSVSRVLLLGTRFTMEKDFYKTRLTEKHGIEVLVPEPGDIGIINDIIYDELVLGQIKDSSRKKYLEIIDRAIEKGAGGVVLGCTEIPLLVKQEDVSVP